MSLKSYLFSLIGILIVLLTVSQLTLLNWMKTNFSSEVAQQALQVSEKVLMLATEKFESEDINIHIEYETDDGTGHKQKIITTSQLDNIENLDATNKNNTNSNHAKHQVKVIPVNPRERVIVKEVNSDTIVINAKQVDSDTSISDSTQQAQWVEQQNQTKAIVIKEFSELVNELHDHAIEDSNVRFVRETTQVNGEHLPKHSNSVTRILSTEHPINALIDKIYALLVICALIALVLAYWLSHKFSKPLNALTGGFATLATGDYSKPVKEQGVTEIKSTIGLFNQMVKRLEQLSAAEKKNQQLQQLAELGEVSKGLAHALRNPIHTIGLNVEQLQVQTLTEQQKSDAIATISAKISHINKTIDALLKLTQTGLSHDQEVPILAVVQDVVLECKAGNDKQLEFAINGPSDAIVIGNESEIRSILHTLIVNAVEASNANDEITITIDSDSSNLKVLVEDSGNGLNPEIAAQLFNPHVSDKSEGAGMGLYIAKRLITLNYNGTIELNNKSNEANGCIAIAQFKSQLSNNNLNNSLSNKQQQRDEHE